MAATVQNSPSPAELPPTATDSGWTRLLNASRSFGLERQVVHHLLSRLEAANIALTLWDGQQLGDAALADVHIHVGNRSALWSFAMDPVDALPELYTSRQIELEGDVVRLLRVVNEQLRKDHPQLSGRHVPRAAVQPHQGVLRGAVTRGRLPDCELLPVTFYETWLDRSMLFSAGDYSASTLSLDDAQLAKCDTICRQLDLRPGEHVLELGAGWGGLARFAAREYAVQVTAYSTDAAQVQHGRDTDVSSGLESQIEWRQGGWDALTGEYDAIVCVEALESIATEEYGDAGERIRRCLKPGGRGLIQVVTRSAPQSIEAQWIDQHLVPCVHPPALSQLWELFEFPGLTVDQLSNRTSDYIQTLQDWRMRFEDVSTELQSQFGDAIFRAWRLYLASRQAAFEAGSLQLQRVLFHRNS